MGGSKTILVISKRSSARNQALSTATERSLLGDYEGEIKAYGDTVKINSIGAVTISDYTKNG